MSASEASLQLDPVYRALEKYPPLMTFGTFLVLSGCFIMDFILDFSAKPI